MTITIEVTGEAEDRLRSLAARRDLDAMRQAIAEAALPTAERLLRDAEKAEQGDDPLTKALARLAARTLEEIARAQEQARASLLPARALPEGATLLETVGGKWPGGETDEEVAAALDRIS